jgi:tRNA-dihydrouridine synthase B
VVAQQTRPSLFLIQDPAERDLVHQIAGAEPELMGDAAALLADRGAVRLDLNMGCSAPLIVCRGWGVALMHEPARAREVVQAVRKRFPGHLSAKIRLGWREDAGRLEEFCRMLEAEGIQTLAVHPRLKHEKFKGRSRWDRIAAVREAVRIPVVGNGDVCNPGDAERIRTETGCDAVMIGREAARRPWVFREIAEGARLRPDPLGVIRSFIGLLERYLPEERHLSRLKIFLAWFAQPLPFGHTLRTRVQNAATMQEAQDRIGAFFASSG